MILAPLRLPVAMSPLVVVQRVPTTANKSRTPSNFATPFFARGGGTARAPVRVPLQDRTPVQGTAVATGEEGEDVSSPEAARARTSAVSLNYKDIQTPTSGVRWGGGARTPATVLAQRQRNPSIPLHRAVLLSTGLLFVCLFVVVLFGFFVVVYLLVVCLLLFTCCLYV